MLTKKRGDIWVSPFRCDPFAQVLKSTNKMVRFVEVPEYGRHKERVLSHKNFEIYFPKYAGNAALSRKWQKLYPEPSRHILAKLEIPA